MEAGDVTRLPMFDLLTIDYLLSKQVLNLAEWRKCLLFFRYFSMFFNSVLEPPITNYRHLCDYSQTLQVSIMLFSARNAI